MICCALAVRSLRGFSVMKKLPLLPARPLPPIAMATVATSGSACTILPSASWWRTMSAKEMSWRASEVAVIRPMSCCGKKPFGNDDEQIDRQAERGEEDHQRREAPGAAQGRDRAHSRAACRRRPARSIGRSVPCRSSPWARRKRDAIIGVSVSDTNIETKMVIASTTANSRNRRPMMPPISSSGISTATSERLIETMVKPISLGALEGGRHRRFRLPRCSA